MVCDINQANVPGIKSVSGRNQYPYPGIENDISEDIPFAGFKESRKNQRKKNKVDAEDKKSNKSKACYDDKTIVEILIF
jgi:hypothetical protein